MQDIFILQDINLRANNTIPYALCIHLFDVDYDELKGDLNSV